MAAAFTLAHYLVPLWLATAWLASVRWAREDARARVHNRRAVRAATLLATLAPLAGAAVWLCVRPSETLAERRERRLTRLLLELEAGVHTPVVAPRGSSRAEVVEPAGELAPAA